MANKKSNNNKKAVVPVASHTALQTPKTVVQPWHKKTEPKPKEDKREFILSLLEQAGTQGITWQDIQAQLQTKYGMAPKKRHSLYVALDGKLWHKTTESKGIVRYYLGKPPRTRAKTK